MDQALHARLRAGPRQLLRQLDMGAVESCLVAMQDGDKVDDGIVPGHQLGQRCVVMNVAWQYGQQG